MSSKGKRTKKQHVVKEEKVELTITNYIYPSGCQNVQIGSNNKIVYPVTEANHLLNHKDQSDLTRNEILIGMINSIINPSCSSNPKEMSVWDLKNKFENIYGNSFEKLYGLRINQFLERNPEWFLQFQIKKRMMVKPIIRVRKRPQKALSKRLSNENNDVDVLGCPGINDSETETDYMTADASSGIDDFPLFSDDYSASSENDEDNTLKSSSSSHSNSWTVVKRKSKHRGKVTSVESSSSMYPQRTVDHDELLSLFKSLIDKPESSDLLFRKSMTEYIKHPCEFLLDVVSMWNTPARSKSHIVIGVDMEKDVSERLVGIRDSVEISRLHRLIHPDAVTFKPEFYYYEIFTNKKLFGILEIPSSHGSGVPTITKINTCMAHNKCRLYSKDELWYRCKTGRKTCNLSDPFLSCIYQWFSVCSKDEKTKHVSKLKSLKPLEMKNAGTSTSHDSGSSEDSSDPQASMIGPTLTNFKKAVQGFTKGRYVLVSGDVSNGTKDLEAFSTVPWIAVYDFDIMSRDTGLLCANESFLSNRRSLHLTTWEKNSAIPICENSTVWSFLRGRRDEPESRLKEEKDPRGWYKRVKESIDQQLEYLQKFIEGYTVLTFLILWPKDEMLSQFIHKFLLCVDENLDPSPNMVLCFEAEPKTKIGKSFFSVLPNEIGKNLKLIQTDLPNICQWINEITKDKQNIAPVKYEIPSGENGLSKGIDEKEAAWLREELEVLYLSNIYAKAKTDANALVEETENFFRGGSLHWFAWYECGVGHFDVERNIMKDVKAKIKNYIDENKAGIITLYHAPGAGGTTLAQRIIWDYHTKIPCAHVKLRSLLPVEELVNRIEMLYDKSHKTILLLIDGEDETKIKHLMRMLKARCYAVILYVKRFPYNPYKLKKIGNGAKSFLEGVVSKQEAKRLSLKFRDRCENDQTKIKRLMDLSDDVESDIKHHLYEFGMTTYSHEFKGVESYVRGYLQLEKNIGNQLQPSQVILGYLSLAYYYGQTSLPLQFFVTLLHKPSNYCLELTDLPYPVQEFVVMDVNESKKDNVRICHYIVAKEILEQLLLSGNTKNRKRTSDFSTEAKQRLADFCKMFIDYCGKRKVKSGGALVHILTKIFIFRDNKEMGENAVQNKRKPALSRLMTDICSKPPLFTERLKVLDKLTETFPNDPNFHAHLGRFYACCRPDKEDIAERCFQKALELCEKQSKGKNVNEIEERILHSLTHIYHMYGNILQKRIARYTGLAPGDEPELQTDPECFTYRMNEILPLAKRSCSYFRKCREHTPPGHESCFGFTGEINVRLQICDFVERNFSDSEEVFGIDGYLKSSDENDDPAIQFIQKSIFKIDNLLMECYSVVDEEDIDYSIQKVVMWFNHLFYKHAETLDSFSSGDDIHSCRLKIAAKKLRCGTRERSLKILENITQKEEIEEIIGLYENIFQNIPLCSFKGSKATLDRDYQEWLFAVRHKYIEKEYSLEEVLLRVRQWNDYLHSPMSKYYLFIILSLLGFGKENINGNSECLTEAIEIHQADMIKSSKMVLKPRYPREWLGRNGTGIKVVESGIRFLGNNTIDERNLKDEMNNFQICKGTICRPNNKKLSGYISLDLGNSIVPVRVFYIPHTARMANSSFAGARVEFILAFTLHHGYEAFNVKILNKYSCPNNECSSRSEMTSIEKSKKCAACGHTILNADLKT